MRKLYWYEYKFRGFSPGCQPNDFIEWDDEYGRLGAVAYRRKLTPKELEDYELHPIER